MFTGKRRLAVAALLLFAIPASGADFDANAEGERNIRNPALPSQDDLISFDYPTPGHEVTLDEMGANQRAFPLFYGAPAATPGTLISASPSSTAPVGGTENIQVKPNGMLETGQPVHYAGGIVTRTYVSQPVQETPEAAADIAQTLAAATQATGTTVTTVSQNLRPTGTLKPPGESPASLNAQSGVEDTLSPGALSEQRQTSVASAVPHTGAEQTETAPPTLGTTVDPDSRRLASSGAKATSASTTPKSLDDNSEKALARAEASALSSPPGSLRPASETDTSQLATAPSSKGKEFTPGAKDTIPEKGPAESSSPLAREPDLALAEPAFPMTSITPPPIPSSGASLSGIADSQPTVGLAEFRGVKALDGTPLPPPPPAPEKIAERPKAPSPVKADPAQVRADFNRLKAFCEEDSLGSAAEIYAHMPDFGTDEEINRLRADAANLLILGLARNDNLRAARRIFDSVPVDVSGYDASLAKTRGIINLATYYVRAERFNDAFDVLITLDKIGNRSPLNNELFRLMARMIPYLDNADETEKATQVYDMLIAEIKSPGTATLFADNIQGVLKYYLHYVDRSENPIARRKRMDFLEHIYSSLAKLKDNPEVRLVRRTVGISLADRYSGDPDRAAQFLEN